MGGTNHSIRQEQGSVRLSAGNQFSQSLANSIHFESQSPFSIDYYHSSDPIEIPVVSELIYKYLATNQNGCPPHNDISLPMDEEDFGKALARYDEWHGKYEYWLAILNATEEGSEEYEQILDNVSYFSTLKDNYFNSIIVAAMNNYELPITNYDTLRFLFAYRGQYQDYLSITETYLAENNFNQAFATTTQMFDKFELSEEQVSELSSLQLYTRWLQQLDEKGETIYKLPENEIEYLVNYVETRSGRGVVFANNILCGLYGICLENYELRITNYGLEEGEADENPPSNIEGVDGKAGRGSLLANITLVPNPTTGQLTIINEQLTIINIEIYDVFGRKLPSVLTDGAEGRKQNNINISKFTAGIYFVKVKTEAGETVKKIIKN
jgi:hypothetical protein